MPFFFTRSRKFSVIISSIGSQSLALFSSIASLMQFQGCLKLSSFFKILFSFCCSDCFFYLVSKLLIWSTASSNLLFVPSSVFFISAIVFFISDWFFFMVYVSSFISLNTLITIILNSVSSQLLASISFSSFSRGSSVLSFGACFFLSPFWLPLCVCSYVLCRSAMTPRLCEVALCSRCPVACSGAVPLFTWPGCSRNVLF